VDALHNIQNRPIKIWSDTHTCFKIFLARQTVILGNVKVQMTCIHAAEEVGSGAIQLGKKTSKNRCSMSDIFFERGLLKVVYFFICLPACHGDEWKLPRMLFVSHKSERDHPIKPPWQLES
jgi:hypothetical protein